MHVNVVTKRVPDLPDEQECVALQPPLFSTALLFLPCVRVVADNAAAVAFEGTCLLPTRRSQLGSYLRCLEGGGYHWRAT